MFKSQRAAYLVLLVGLDILAFFLAFVAAWALRDSLGTLLVWAGQAVSYPVKEMVRNTSETSPFYRILLSPNPLVGFNNHLFIFYLAIPGWLFFLNAQRGYDPQAQRNSRQEFALCAYAGMLGTAAFLVMLYLIKFQVSRLLILNLMLMGVAFLWVSRTVLLPLMLRRGRQPIRHLVVIGSREATANFAKVLQTPAYRASRLVGFISDEPDTDATSTQKVGNIELTNLGRLDDLVTVLDRQVVDEVVLVRSTSDAVTSPQKWGNILELCLQRGRTVSLVDDMVPPVGAKVEATMVGTMPTLVLHNTPQNPLGLALKNVMDRAVALVAIIIFSPLLLGIAIAIKLTSPGPILFKQSASGLTVVFSASISFARWS
jgi:hypothetical protein